MAIRKDKKGHNLEAPKEFLEASKPYRWKPGHAPVNQKHLPKLKTLTVILRTQLEEPAICNPSAKQAAEQQGLDPEHSTCGSVLAAVMIATAINGDTDVMKEILNRVDGKVVEAVQLNIGPISQGLKDEELEDKVRSILLRKAGV